jgi:hypothetical protein
MHIVLVTSLMHASHADVHRRRRVPDVECDGVDERDPTGRGALDQVGAKHRGTTDVVAD